MYPHSETIYRITMFKQSVRFISNNYNLSTYYQFVRERLIVWVVKHTRQPTILFTQ